MTDPARSRLFVLLAPIVGALLLAGPASVLGHGLSNTYQSRLPLIVYLAGAALAVGLSFAFLLVADVRAVPPKTGAGHRPPALIRLGLQAIGLLALLWIVAQGIAGGNGSGEVATLFLWVYGWVGLAMLSAFVCPVWHWLDPFTTIHDLGAALLRRVGVQGWAIAHTPRVLGRWPAVIGLAFFVWLELVGNTSGPRALFIVLIGYTAFTLAMMAQFGRDAWRSDGETFSVWFGLLGRLAPYALVGDPAAGRVERRSFASGLLLPGWRVEDVVLIGIGTGSILFDGLSQTQPWFSVLGAPDVPIKTLQLVGFVGLIVAASLIVSRLVGIPATAAGLLPIAAGYLVAHYFTYLLIDGQRIIVAIADPLQQGWDLGNVGWAFFEPSSAWLPPGLVWTIQLAAVVGGHMLGAWGGHVVLARETGAARGERGHRTREVPLAVIMVALTTLTLWSLGQALVVEAPMEMAWLRRLHRPSPEPEPGRCSWDERIERDPTQAGQDLHGCLVGRAFRVDWGTNGPGLPAPDSLLCSIRSSGEYPQQDPVIRPLRAAWAGSAYRRTGWCAGRRAPRRA
ncbi:MAG: hypothetical protein H0U52_13345 [Chloroflexi bacterium]|nr:hypothetical protein [Chloroflexota bacterium]